MLLRTLSVGAVLMLLTSPVLASDCPNQIKKVTQALASNTSLSAERKAHAMKLRDKAKKLHKAGKHDESLELLARAKVIAGKKK